MSSEIYTEKEKKIIEMSLDAKINMIAQLTGDKEVSKEERGKIRLLNEVLNGADASVNAFANTRLKSESDKNQAVTQARTLDILKNISRTKKPTGKTISVFVEEVKELGDDEIVFGETQDGYEELSLATFVKGKIDDQK